MIGQLRERLRRFVATEIAPYSGAWERAGEIPRAVYASFAAHGFAGTRIPTTLGGLGGDVRHAAVLAEEIMRCKATSVAVSLVLPSASACPMLVRHAPAELRDELLRPVVQGRSILGIAVTEPAGGSDLVHGVQCRAEDAGDAWILDGEKMFVTNAPIADAVLVLVRTGEPGSPLGMTLVASPLPCEGVELVKRHATLGLAASPTGWLRFRRCRISKRNTVGAVGRGYFLTVEAMLEERAIIAAGAVAFAAACLRDVLASAPADASVDQELVLLAAEAEACKSFNDAVLERLAAGDGDRDGACIAKFSVCEKVQRIIERAIELAGAESTWAEGWPAHAARDARGLSVYAGSSETVRDLFGMGLLRRARALQKDTAR